MKPPNLSHIIGPLPANRAAIRSEPAHTGGSARRDTGEHWATQVGQLGRLIRGDPRCRVGRAVELKMVDRFERKHPRR